MAQDNYPRFREKSFNYADSYDSDSDDASDTVEHANGSITDNEENPDAVHRYDSESSLDQPDDLYTEKHSDTVNDIVLRNINALIQNNHTIGNGNNFKDLSKQKKSSQLEMANGNGTDSTDQYNGITPSHTNNFTGIGPAVKDQANGKASPKNKANNGNGTKFQEDCDEMVPVADRNRVKHKEGALKKVGKLYSDDESEWIKYRRMDEADPEGGLPYSGKFHNGMMSMKLHGDGCLLTSSNKYIAIVTIDRIDELDRATSFEQASGILERNLTKVKVLLDVDNENAEKAKEMFEKRMDELSTNSFEILQNAGDLLHISMVLQNNKKDKNYTLELINQNQNISSHMKQIINQYVVVCADFENRKGLLDKIKDKFKISKSSWVDVLKETLKKGAALHKQKALDMCLSMLNDSFVKILDNNIFFVTFADVKFFSDMNNTLDKDIFQEVLATLADNYCETIANIIPNLSTKVMPINNPIYFYLCKSLTDVIKEINTRTGAEFDVWYSNGKWKYSNHKWVKSTMDKCIANELNMLIRMLDHFEPGKPSALQNFDYTFKIFNCYSKSNQEQELPTEIHVWLCLLDDTIHKVLRLDRNIDQLCSYLLTLYKSCTVSETSTMDSMESLRVITHNTIKYLALGAPFCNSKNGLDRGITLSQINTIKKATSGKQMSFLNYRDLVEVFAQYWKQRGEFSDGITAKLPGDYFKDYFFILQNILLRSMHEALRKNIELAELINFCRAYDELLTDLLDLSFDWYVRLEKEKNHDLIKKRQLIELVRNKWQDSEHKCYRVKQVHKFASRLLMADEEIPKHYILEIVKNMLNSIYNMIKAQQWKGGIQLTELEQISSASLMIASVRSCLVFLKEQPDYIDFDTFLEENSEPFATLSAKCTSFEEFKKRVLLIKESFWYIRNLNAIDIEKALKLLKLNNENNYNEDYLRMAYKIYSEQFEIYMAANEEMTSEGKIQHIVAEVKSTVVYKLTPDWDFEFKQNVLPRLLAGMGAVWALHTSKDVAITGQFLKPHCIQVLGVLRLLSADNDSQGVKKHLAQILTGQGKSLVLGMTASVLALCGHSVTIMCYSDYLAIRDQQDFEDFYNYFEVRSKVEYKTFAKAASDEFHKYSCNAGEHIRNCLEIPLLPKNKQIDSPENPVLLIDEVDVFFNEILFGQATHLVEILEISGLAEIQVEIWRLVTNGMSNIRQQIDTFINKSSNKNLAEFRILKNKSKTYKLIQTYLDKIVEHECCNSILFSKHIDEMIQNAEKVYSKKDKKKFLSNYRINENGKICYMTGFGVYSETFYSNYHNIFVYFLLKKTDFVLSNYGYLLLDLGCSSYAKLPESYPLILGVTGTLTNLGQYEKKVVKEYYKITESSVMPSFFGDSNLQFDEIRDINCYQTTSDWMNSIFSRINTIVNDKRAVLVIFDTEESINNFKQQFGGQLDRLNILTVNTNDKEKEQLINDSGVSRTITLATREMGRGVDYKSSVTVEKHGGVHVIQTFFSLDIKEETQIKGRTARKDNRGSYEMILCYEDLKTLGLEIDHFEAEITYQRLSSARDKYNVKNDKNREDNVQKSNEKHMKTIEFYGKV